MNFDDIRHFEAIIHALIPGTGKTDVVVDAGMVAASGGGLLLITTQSNKASDEIADRLLASGFPEELLFRMNSLGRSFDGRNESLDSVLYIG